MIEQSTLLIGDIGLRARRWLTRLMPATAIALALESGWLYYDENPGATAFLLIALGTYIVLAAWCGKGLSVPILPMLAVQHLVVYGLPIAIRHEVINAYPEDFLIRAGTEVLIFCCALSAGWRAGLQLFSFSSWSCYALKGFSGGGTDRLRRLGFGLIFGATGYLVLQTSGWLEPIFSRLPSGISIVAATGVAAASSCGFFLIAMLIGSGQVAGATLPLFWVALALNCLIQAAGLLLSAATTVVASVMIGLFWGSGRVPWRYLVVVIGALAYLSLGKYTMRQQYWREGSDAPTLSLARMPEYYAQWSRASFEALSSKGGAASGARAPSAEDGQISLFERVNNLQNILFVIDAMDRNHIPSLGGETYALIPPLFIPRFLWPEKPRSHEGQVRLNVHFGRQDLASTEHTYIAWGLLPEAYGNFGPWIGAILLGLVLGLGLAWVEKATTRKLLLSLEGFLLFTFFLGLTNSFEMVGSVLATSVFQGSVTVFLAALPFVARTDVRKLLSSPA